MCVYIICLCECVCVCEYICVRVRVWDDVLPTATQVQAASVNLQAHRSRRYLFTLGGGGGIRRGVGVD